MRWPADGVDNEDGDGDGDGDGAQLLGLGPRMGTVPDGYMGTVDSVNALGAPPVGAARLERQT